MYGAFKFGSNFYKRHHTRSKTYDWYIMMVIDGIGEHQVNMVSTVSMPYSLLKNAMTLNIGIFRIADGDRKSIYFWIMNSNFKIWKITWNKIFLIISSFWNIPMARVCYCASLPHLLYHWSRNSGYITYLISQLNISESQVKFQHQRILEWM